MKQRHLPVWEQSTAALLLGLQNAAVAFVLGESGSNVDLVKQQWRELHKRKLPLAEVAAAGLSWEIACAAASRAILPILTDKGLVGSAAVHDATMANEWHDFLLAQYSDYETAALRKEAPARGITQRNHTIIPMLLRELGRGEAIQNELSRNPVIGFCLSPKFLLKLAQWFGRALAEDMDWEYLARVPPIAVFSGLESRSYKNDYGRWLWERFTQTGLDGWHLSSLIFEQRWQQHGEARGTSEKLLREREIAAADVADAAFNQLGHRKQTPIPAGFDPTSFVDRAIQLLGEGKAEEAADIFQGIVELRPVDPDAWNNLGFCQIRFDPRAALYSLGRSAMFGDDVNELRAANQMLALHLAGRNTDAELLGAMSVSRQPRGASAWLWLHERPGDGESLAYMQVRVYIEDLLAHIRGGACAD